MFGSIAGSYLAAVHRNRLLVQRRERGRNVPATPLSKIFEISKSGFNEAWLKEAARLRSTAPSLGSRTKVHPSSAKLKQNEQLHLFLMR
jgi:hypothetical protein